MKTLLESIQDSLNESLTITNSDIKKIDNVMDGFEAALKNLKKLSGKKLKEVEAIGLEFHNGVKEVIGMDPDMLEDWVHTDCMDNLLTSHDDEDLIKIAIIVYADLFNGATGKVIPISKDRVTEYEDIVAKYA